MAGNRDLIPCPLEDFIRSQFQDKLPVVSYSHGGLPSSNEPRLHYCIMEILINITDYVSVNFHQNHFFSDSRKTSLNP